MVIPAFADVAAVYIGHHLAFARRPVKAGSTQQGYRTPLTQAATTRRSEMPQSLQPFAPWLRMPFTTRPVLARLGRDRKFANRVAACLPP